MAKRVRVETDGITQTVKTTYVLAGQPVVEVREMISALERSRTNNSFERKISDVEAYLKTLARGKTPRYGSRAYYARTILERISAVRDLRQRGAVDTALASAMSIGYLAAEWQAKGWPDLLLGRKHRSTQRVIAMKGVVAKREDRAPSDARFLAAVLAERKKNPGAKPREIARALLPAAARQSNGPDRMKAIDKLRQRIKRLTPGKKE